MLAAALLAPALAVPARAPGSAAAGLDCAPAPPVARSVRELVTVVAPSRASTTAELSLLRRVGSCFVGVGGPYPARLGAGGLSTHHVEGEPTTPEGVFSFGSTMYGVLPDPGVSYRYHELVCGDYWDEDPRSPSYNEFVHVACGSSPPFGGDSEALWREAPDYDYLAVIDYNTSPVVPGRGSGIFLHLGTAEPTLGCVSLSLGDLLATLRFLRREDHPVIALGTADDILTI